jgi:magnesium-transporting ATPase (P-type)
MKGMTFLGLQAMSDPARPEAIESVRLCKEAGISVKMITGDHVITAIAIARDLGIGGRNVKSITGTQLAALSDEEFSEAAFSNSVFARVAPEQKYRLVEALQAGNEIVAMTGDGVNDAPALKKADVGVGMGATGSEVAKDAADMVLTDDNFSSIVAAVEEGRTVFANITKTLAWILPTSLGQGLVIVAALIMRYTLPVTPVQVLWINTVTAITLALPLAFESKEPGIMQLKPRNPNAPLLDGAVITRIFIVAVSMVIGAFIIFLYEKGQGASINEARTAAVATIVAYEVFYLFSARSERIPVWKTNPFSNPYIWVGVFLVTLFQLAFTYLPALNYFFGSAPLPWDVWLRVILVSFPIMIIVGIEKAIRVKYSKILR